MRVMISGDEQQFFFDGQGKKLIEIYMRQAM